MAFYQVAGTTSGSSLGIHWSPLLKGAYGTVKPDYIQTWMSDSPLAVEAGESCFGSPDWLESGGLSFIPRVKLKLSPLSVKFVEKEGRANIQGNNQVSLSGPDRALLYLSFSKEKNDDSIMFNFKFLRPGEGDEFVAWIDDFRLLSLAAPEDGVEEGRVAIGIDDFEEGPHSLVFALYPIVKRDAALSISNLERVTFE
jgi:hypothetical protein